MDTHCTNTPKPKDILENATKFEGDLAKADTVRASALAGLQKLHTARARYAQRERMHLAATSGENDADVIRLKTEVAIEERFGKALNAEIDRATITRPAVDERAWTLYGFVRDQDLQGQPNLTVALFDRKNHWIEALGHACTDSRGCFQLRYAQGGEPGTNQRWEVFLRVLNRKQEILYRDKKPMIAIIGEITYREVILTGESESCQPPSDATSTESPDPTKSSAKTSKARKARSTTRVRKEKKT